MMDRMTRVWLGLRNLLREERGMVGIEYGVFAAFIVLALVGVAVVAGPKIARWLGETVDCVISGSC